MEPVNVVWSVLSSSTRSVLRRHAARFIQSGRLSKSHVVIDDGVDVEDKSLLYFIVRIFQDAFLSLV